MNAADAKLLAEHSPVKNLKIESWLNVIYDRIERQAAQGKFELTHPFTSSNGLALARTPGPTNEEAKEIYRRLEEQGYVVTHHPNPEPQDPRSSGWTSISWR